MIKHLNRFFSGCVVATLSILVGACGTDGPPAGASSGASYQRGEQGAYSTASACKSYEPVYFSSYFGTPSAQVNHIDAGSISVVWGNDYSGISRQSDVATLTQLKTDPVLRQNVVDRLLKLQSLITDQFQISVNPSKSAVDGKCYRTSVYMKGTGVFVGDTVEGGGGGTLCGPITPTIQVGHGDLVYLSTAFDATQPLKYAPYTTSHEFTHALQCSVKRGGDQTGWSWFIESFANYIGNIMENATVAIDQFHQTAFWSLDAYFHRYGEWPFWMYLSQKFGYIYTSDVLQRTSEPTESTLEFLRRTLPFNCTASDMTCRNGEFGDMFIRFASSTVNYADYSKQQGRDYRASAISQWGGLPRSSAYLENVGTNRYRIADWLAPQRYAFNIIQLVPDPSNRTLSIDLEGWDVSARGADWRAIVVATLDDATVPPVEAYGTLFKTGTQTIDLNQWESQLGSTIKKLQLVVAAVPTNWKKDSELSGFTAPERYRELDRFVYELTLGGAWPLGHEPQNLRASPGVAGAAHANGGGFVASTATVDATAYVGPEARVLGNAQVLGNARIEGRAIIQDSAIVKDNAIVSSRASMMTNSNAQGYATIRDNVLLRDQSAVIGDGKLQGDATVYSTFLVSGSAVSLGVPLIETTGAITLTGTAISNGARWFSSGTISQGTPYNSWGVNDAGLLMGYDFSLTHPYRIKDVHVDSDAYYLSASGRIGNAPDIQTDATLASNVLVLNGTGYIQMPKWSLDQRNYKLTMLFNWAGGSATQYLLDANTTRGEQLAIQIIPGTGNAYDTKLLFKDRLGASREALLQDVMLQTGQWINLEMNYDFNSASMILKTNIVGSATVAQASIAMPYPTREMDYDTLDIRVGANQAGTQLLNASLDDIKIYRY